MAIYFKIHGHLRRGNMAVYSQKQIYRKKHGHPSMKTGESMLVYLWKLDMKKHGHVLEETCHLLE